MLHATLVAACAFAWIAASGSAHAAKDVSMCAGLKGAAKGLCTAAAALGCDGGTKHQAQCDALGDKFEALTGNAPPWEPVPPPPPPQGRSATLLFDVDAFDLEGDVVCEDALGNECNRFDLDFIRPPNDFWLAEDFDDPEGAILVPVLTCDTPVFTVAIAVTNVPFADVTLSTPLVFTENLPEVAIGPGDTIVLQTCDVGFFKIGNVSIGSGAATVSYERLTF